MMWIWGKGSRFAVRNKFWGNWGMIEWRRIQYSNTVKWNARLLEHVFGENKQTVSTGLNLACLRD